MPPSLWQRFLDLFRACEETRWCLKCNRRVPCQYGRNHKGRQHGHYSDAFGRGHQLEWFNARP